MHFLQQLISEVGGGSPDAWRLDNTWTSKTKNWAPLWHADTKAVHQLTRKEDERRAFIEEDADGDFSLSFERLPEE
jgi:hypothetical protein